MNITSLARGWTNLITFRTRKFIFVIVTNKYVHPVIMNYSCCYSINLSIPSFRNCRIMTINIALMWHINFIWNHCVKYSSVKDKSRTFVLPLSQINFKGFKGTVQRKLTGIESGINQKAFLWHWTDGFYFTCRFQGNLLFKFPNQFQHWNQNMWLVESWLHPYWPSNQLGCTPPPLYSTCL